MTTGGTPDTTPSTDGQFTPQQLEVIVRAAKEAVDARIPGVMSSNATAQNEIKERLNRLEDGASPNDDPDKPRGAQTAKERELRQREEAVKVGEIAQLRSNISSVLKVPAEHLKGDTESELTTSALLWLTTNSQKPDDPPKEEPAKTVVEKPTMTGGNPPGGGTDETPLSKIARGLAARNN